MTDSTSSTPRLFPMPFPFFARRLARRLNVPFLLTPFLHLGDPLDRRDRTRRAYTSPALLSLARDADVVFAQTPTERDALVKCGVLPQRVILQGLGVDIAACTGGDGRRARQSWGMSTNEVVLGHLANNSAEKGTVDLLRAAESLWQAGNQFRLVLAGPEMPGFQQFWKDYRYAQKVTRLGPLTDVQKRDFFAAIDVFALPSRSDSFGLVLLEAWANRLPNIAYHAGGIADVVRHGVDGLLAPCGEVPALAMALRRVITDAGMRHQLAPRDGTASKTSSNGRTSWRWSGTLRCSIPPGEDLARPAVDVLAPARRRSSAATPRW